MAGSSYSLFQGKIMPQNYFFPDFPPVFKTKSFPLPGSKLAVDQPILSDTELVDAVNVKYRKSVKDQVSRVLHIPVPKAMGFIFESCSPKSSQAEVTQCPPQ